MSETFDYRNLSRIQAIKSLSPEEIFSKNERVKKSFIGYKIYEDSHGYPYSFFPLTDGPITASLVGDMADLLVLKGNFENANHLLTEGDRGGCLIAGAVGDRTGIPIIPSNWHREMVDIPEIVCVEARVGFSGDGYILIYGIEPGQEYDFADDLLSSGGTALAHFGAVRKAGGIIKRAYFVGEKVNQNGRENIAKEFPDIEIISLVRFISKGEFTQDADI